MVSRSLCLRVSNADLASERTKAARIAADRLTEFGTAVASGGQPRQTHRLLDVFFAHAEIDDFAPPVASISKTISTAGRFSMVAISSMLLPTQSRRVDKLRFECATWNRADGQRHRQCALDPLASTAFALDLFALLRDSRSAARLRRGWLRMRYRDTDQPLLLNHLCAQPQSTQPQHGDAPNCLVPRT